MTLPRSRASRVFRLTAAALVVAAGVGLAAAPAQAATPVKSAAIGDGFTAPSHDPSLSVIPLCKGPVAVSNWLNANFKDHGRDSAAYIKRNVNTLTALASGKNSVASLGLLTQSVLAVPQYALNDAVFHLPPTALSLATGCGLIGTLGSNPFATLRG